MHTNNSCPVLQNVKIICKNHQFFCITLSSAVRQQLSVELQGTVDRAPFAVAFLMLHHLVLVSHRVGTWSHCELCSGATWH